MNGRRALAILFIVVFIDLVGFGMVLPLMPLYAKRLGAPEAWIGLLGTGYSVMQLVFAPVWGRLSDRFGRRPMLLLSITMTAVAFTAYGLATNFTALLVARLFAGAATANIAIAQAYVADVTPPEGRARGMGIIGAAFGLGFVFGPAIGAWLGANVSLGAPFFAAAALSAANLVAAWAILPEPEHRAPAVPRTAFRALFDELSRPGIRRVLVCSFVTILSFSIMEATYSLLAADRYALDAEHVGYVFAYIGVLMVIVQGGLVGRLNKRYGETRLLVVGMLLMALALAALPFAPTGLVPFFSWNLPIWLLVATAPLAIGNGLANPALASLLSRHGKADEQGETLGIGQSATALGRVLGPESGTYAFATFGPPFAYVGAAALMVVASLVGATVRPPPKS